MLLNLHVKNLAIIDEVDIDFSEGLNILSGETGAGKSIIIGSINLALGARVSKDIIRNNAEYALVELVFSYSDDRIKEYLYNSDIECDNNEIIISRKITRTRSVCKVNGETVTLSYIQELASMLIDIHGQHDNRMLIDSSMHIELLDQFIYSRNEELFKDVEALFEQYTALKHELDELSIDVEKRNREISLLEYEINEIEAANLREGEDELIDDRFKLLSNMENVLSTLGRVSQNISMDCMESIARALRDFSAISGVSSDIISMNEELSQAESILNDFLRDISDYVDNNEYDEAELEELERRVDLINMLKAKYGDSISKINNYLEKSRERLNMLNHYDETLKMKNEQLKSVETKLEAKCKILSDVRRTAARELSDNIVKSLRELNFNDADFAMDFSRKNVFSKKGYDNVCFMIKSNTGEELKPLSDIASGGELSRVMLAIKSVVADNEAGKTFIFDEIDAGISGRTAQKVAEKLTDIAKNKQIICITHLAQIASMADSHYVIEKNVKDYHTFTAIRKLNDNEIIEELCRIIGGTVITDSVRESAGEMKKLANEYKIHQS